MSTYDYNRKQEDLRCKLDRKNKRKCREMPGWSSVEKMEKVHYDEGDYPTLESSKYTCTPESKENKYVEAVSRSSSWAEEVELQEKKEKQKNSNNLRFKRKLELTSPRGKQSSKRRNRSNQSYTSRNSSMTCTKMNDTTSSQGSSNRDSLEDSQLDASRKSTYPTEVETDSGILTRREKQLELGKSTSGYRRYCTLVPKGKRSKLHPRTPLKNLKWSRRSFDMQVRIWRRQLHVWDPVEKDNPNKEGEIEFKDTSETSSIASGDIAYDDDFGEENFIRSTPQCSQDDEVTVDLMGCALSPLKKKCELDAGTSLNKNDTNSDELDSKD